MMIAIDEHVLKKGLVAQPRLLGMPDITNATVYTVKRCKGFYLNPVISLDYEEILQYSSSLEITEVQSIVSDSHVLNRHMVI